MFKVTGFDLPDKVKKGLAAEPSKKAKKNEAKNPKLSADGLQDLFKQLGRDAPQEDSSTPIAAEEKPAVTNKRSHEESEGPSKKKQKSKAKSDSKPAVANEKPKTQAKADKKQKEPKQANNKESTKERTEESTPAKMESESAAKSAPTPAPGKKQPKLTPMQLKMQQKLSGARFRWINEKLYTTNSQDAVQLFQETPSVFKEYHDGFRHQVESWPENPVDSMMNNFKTRLQKPLNAPGGLPALPDGTVVVADMGCGEAKLALQLSKLKGSSKSRKARFTAHSFDLHKANNRITVADIANVPLPDKSAHVVVFCLSLMGTNVDDFIKEGLRILKPHGEVWIAEIKSRFDIVNGKTDVSRFVNRLKDMGLYHKVTDDSNSHFVKFEFVLFPERMEKVNYKSKKPKFIEEEKDNTPLLKPCIYKRR